jgi:adenine-specific DNA-methyltransferase
MYKKKLGQYFTTNIELQNKILEFILNSPTEILEPSIGQGHLVLIVNQSIPNVKFDMFEIDNTIELLENISKNDVIYADFMNVSITKKYKTIIGNPPYVKSVNGNLYIDFTKKCYELLDDNGELIFIVPSDFLKKTSAAKLLNEMMQSGSITHLYHPHDENLFENASIDVIVYRYCKNNNIDKKILYNNKCLYLINNNGLITFEENITNCVLIDDYFDVFVGFVSGKENVFKNNKLGNMDILNGENKIEKYICINEFPCENENINSYLLSHKDDLINRRIRKFNENNWYEFGALRNIENIKNNLNKDCIYVYNLTRKNNIAFIGKVKNFGGSLIMLLPKRDVDLNNVLKYLNSNDFKKNFMFSNRFKIGHRSISNSNIPIEYL